MFAFSDMVPARVVLYMLSFSGFTVSFMMRNDINIAMVAMVKPPSMTLDTNVTVTSQHCYVTPPMVINNSAPIKLEVKIGNDREIINKKRSWHILSILVALGIAWTC